MNKTTIISTAIYIIILSAIILIPNLIKKPQEKYSYTKAICDKNNYCQDNLITCEFHKLKSIEPITGATTQFDKGWKDPRPKKQIKQLC